MEYRKNPVRVFFFSGYSGEFRQAFKASNIKIEDVLDGVHPFAIIGEPDDKMQVHLKDCVHATSIASIKKNFKNMLSRDKAEYESNIVKQPYGKEVVYFNRTEYLVIDFICCANALYMLNNKIYSDVWPSTALSDVVKQGRRINAPFTPDFNWKYYAGLFAETCLESYDSEHIILIRTNPATYYCKDNDINIDSKITREFGEQIRAIEDDFLEKTHCHCVNEFLRHSPIDERIFVSDKSAYERIADAVAKIIYEGHNGYKEDFFKYKSSTVKSIYKRLTSSKIAELKNDFDIYDNKVSTEIKKYFFENNSEKIFDDLFMLKRFFTDGVRYGLLDYIKEKMNNNADVDIRLIELYTEYFKLEISDIIGVFLIYQKLENKESLRNVVINICKNPDCLPLEYTKGFIQNNQKYLQSYEWIDTELRSELDFDLNRGLLFYPIKISTSGYIILNPNSNGEPIIYTTWKKVKPDINKIVDESMLCNANEIDELSRSWRFYIRRAKSKKGNVPLKIIYKDKTEFQQSLVFVDYYNVLESENAFITLLSNKDDMIGSNKYMCKCNLEILMEENTKIIWLLNGLSDQIQYYIMSKYVEENSGAKILYDDIKITQYPVFNGVEVNKLIIEDKEDFDKRRLSRIVSPRLIEAVERGSFPDFLYDNGWDDISVVVNQGRGNDLNKCTRFIVNEATMKMGALSDCKFHYSLIQPGCYWGECDIHKYLRFPEFVDEKNKEFEKLMLSCDAVVMHFRLGDWLAQGLSPNIDHYKKCINALRNFKGYSNVKYFIFSDDINWCKEHESNLFGEYDLENVYYVDHNKGENSYLDMKLMSLGKVIVSSIGNFAVTAAIMSNRKEIFLPQSAHQIRFIEGLGFKNKYDLLK